MNMKFHHVHDEMINKKTVDFQYIHTSKNIADFSYFYLIPIPTASEVNLAAEKICASEFGDKYEKEQFSNGLAVYKRLVQENWGPDDIVMIYLYQFRVNPDSCTYLIREYKRNFCGRSNHTSMDDEDVRDTDVRYACKYFDRHRPNYLRIDE
jgi:hypothetical protein